MPITSDVHVEVCSRSTSPSSSGEAVSEGAGLVIRILIQLLRLDGTL